MSVSKHKGGLGFRSLYGFNIALVGKQCWKFIKEPQSLVAHIFKARYFPNCHLLQATKQTGASIIWAGLMTAKDALYDGYRWVLGNGVDIDAIKDPWLRDKVDFRVNQTVDYGVSGIPVSEFIFNNERRWDEAKVLEFFSASDASLILETRIPYGTVKDRVAWPRSTDGMYTVKSRYRHWCDKNLNSNVSLQTSGWSRLWRINVPHKVKNFFWRFCRNNIPVCNKLRSKGVQLPII